MATIKSFTDIPQSKVLAKTLPLESADYCWGIDDETLHYNNSPYPCAWKDYTCKEYYLPCWSLAALLDLMPDIIKVEEKCYTFSLIKNVIEYVGHDGNILYSTGGESFVDAAVKMFELIENS